MSDPKYDEDTVSLGFLKKVINQEEKELQLPETIARHYASKPQPPYYKGSTWIDGTIIYTCINDRLIGTYQQSDWTTESGAKQEAERKNKTFLSEPNNYRTGDMWILQSDEDHPAGKQGEILTATTRRETYNASDWTNVLNYGNANKMNEIADNLTVVSGRVENTEEAVAEGMIITFMQATQPVGKHIGDLWIATNDSNKLYRFDGTDWISAYDLRIAIIDAKADTAQQLATTANTNAQNAQSTADANATEIETLQGIIEQQAQTIEDLTERIEALENQNQEVEP
jgi:methyl-accepting chemotaxis protein